MKPVPLSAVLTLVAAAAPAQHLTLAEGAPGALQITVLAESAPAAPGNQVLGDVELLPLEITGRTLAQEFDHTRSRRIMRQGIACCELPGNGRLFRYRRAGGLHWGFLHVRAGGDAVVVLERPGTATGGDPFADRIAVAVDGLHAAVPLGAGGLHAVRLDGQPFASTARADRLVPTALPIEPTSLMIGSSHLFFTTANQAWRCALADGSSPVDVSPPAQPNGILKDEFALSGDGNLAVFLYGPRDQWRLWMVGSSGGPFVLPPPPSKYEEPDYLPGGAGEPAMLLNHDGSRLFYVDSISRDELHLLDTGGALPPLQITADPIFQPYIGVHILPKFAQHQLIIAIGDGGRMDWFRASLAATGGTVSNLTGTGSTAQPFPAGTLDPVQEASTASGLLITERLATGFALRRFDQNTGQTTVLHTDLTALPRAGHALAGPVDLVVPGSAGDRLYLGATGALFATAPAPLHILPPSRGPQVSGTFVHVGNGIGALVFYLPDGTALAGPIEQGVTQVVTTARNGALVVGNPLRYLSWNSYQVLNRPAAAVRFCLSGASI